jgi:superfamily II DNA or RNA helicase
VQLRPYQSLAIAAFQESPLQRQLIVLPTGAGKTITGLALAKALGGRCLWLAHREELISQPAKAAQFVWPEATRGIVKAERNEHMRDLVFASIQSAQQPRRLEQLAAHTWSLIVVDEAHRALAAGYQALFNAVGCYRDGGPRLLGITATPERTDNGALEDVFQGVVFHLGINTAIQQGYLLPPTVVEHAIKLDLDALTITRGDFAQKQLDVALMQAGIVEEITRAYESHCAERKTVIFTVSVAQAKAVADALRARGHAAAAISGETPSEQRASILRKLTRGELRCVVNCAVLTEGFDEPSIDAVILARPTQSKPMMIQCVGRGLRLHPGKSDCLVVDMVGASKRNSFVQAAVIFGIRPEEEKETTGRAVDPISDPEEYWRQRLMSQIKGVRGAPRSKLRWLPSQDGRGWLLPAGAYGTLQLMPVDEESWQVDAVGVREGPAVQRLSDQPVTLDIAQAIAEDYVRRVEAVGVSLSTARWRDDGASEAQAAFLKRNGIEAGNMTKGTAADLITQINAKKNSDPATPKQLAMLRRHGAQTHANMTKREAGRLIAQLRS